MTRTDASRPHPAAPQPGASPLAAAAAPFRRLRTALSVSGLGLWLAVPALSAMAVVPADGTQARLRAVGAVLALLVLPAVLLAPLAGALADRVDRRLALLIADGLRFVVVVTVPLVDALPWTLAAAFLVGCLSLLWAPAASAALPALVSDATVGASAGGTVVARGAAETDLRADARRSAARAAFGSAPVAALLFAVLAVIANAVLGASHRTDLPLYATAALFVLAAVLTALVKQVPATEPISVPAPLKLLFQGPGLDRAGHGLGLAIGGAALAAGAVAAVARVHTGELGGGDAGYGAVLTGLAAGLATGLFLGPRVLGPFSRRRLLGLAVIAAALLLIVAALVRNLVVVAFVAAFLGVAAGAAWSTATAAVRGPAGEAGEETGDRPRAFLRSIALIGTLVAVAAVPAAAGALGSHRLNVGDGYDLDGSMAAQLIAAVLALIAGAVAYRRLDDRRGIPLVADLRAALRGEVYVPPSQAAAPEPVRRERGVFVAFEGGEGAGKTTQARLAAIWLRDHGYDVITTHEPGATKIGMRLRAMLLDRDTTGLSDRAETLLYAADRADHVANVIRPALERGAIVVSDRYLDSSLAYQGYGRQQPVNAIARVNAWATGGLVPDLTVLLEVPPADGLRRLSAPADRIESEPQEFHERVQAGFRALAEADPDRYLVLDASRPQAELSREIQYRIREILPDPIPAGTEDATSTFPAITDV
ncbi:dTMP kinase [Actinomadura verrucosospora]|uniref:Thymidylate kinase n=1 Tax=Actinomadura verrucosospora TaxID=46165 RepID=A0A7D3VZT7_ACTVE|nr:dTMP kinase [Actinomadura verrucosospora]QKG22892.1 thymidylate kinase [Actinomadura verrucosospora]